MEGDPTEDILEEAGLVIETRQVENDLQEFDVSGSTHRHRKLLHSIGGSWDSHNKVWTFKDQNPTFLISDALVRSTQSDSALTDSDAKTSKPHYHGHRQRLRDRFIAAPPENLPDYELLELLLFYSVPRIDVKPLAKQLIERFGSFGAVFAAEPERLQEFDKISSASAIHLKAIREASLRLSREDINEQVVLSSWKKLIAYCRAGLAHETQEQFKVLFLNARNALIADEVQQRGTVDHTPVYPREVVKRSLELGATAFIMVHNHPSGDPTPSKADISMTKQVRDAAAGLGITLHDHLIISKNGYTSFKESGLL